MLGVPVQPGSREGNFQLGQSARGVWARDAVPVAARALPILNGRTAGRLNHGAARRGLAERTPRAVCRLVAFVTYAAVMVEPDLRLICGLRADWIDG